MLITVVIPTCNRKKNLLFLLDCLNKSSFILHEIIIVDSGEDRLSESEILSFSKLNIEYKSSEKSVCIQRNIGIKASKGEWVFLCDDDIEVPADYLEKLSAHINEHPGVGTVSGLVLQKYNDAWVSNYPVKSNFDLISKYVFKLSIWGPLPNTNARSFIKNIKHYYAKKSNHISKAGWPVITNFSGNFFETPLYGLGASLIKKEWLLKHPFDEVLDRYGIGDNYGIAVQFPSKIHVVKNAFVYHHHEVNNRLQYRIAYYRRILALDYFRQTIPSLKFIKKHSLLWSLSGNFLLYILSKNFYMIWPTFKAMIIIFFNQNDYYKASLKNQKITTPIL